MNLSPFFKELAGLLPGGRRGTPADPLSPGPGTQPPLWQSFLVRVSGWDAVWGLHGKKLFKAGLVMVCGAARVTRYDMTLGKPSSAASCCATGDRAVQWVPAPLRWLRKRGQHEGPPINTSAASMTQSRSQPEREAAEDLVGQVSDHDVTWAANQLLRGGRRATGRPGVSLAAPLLLGLLSITVASIVGETWEREIQGERGDGGEDSVSGWNRLGGVGQGSDKM